MTREALESGWQPVPQYGNPEWDAITALAELSDDSQLLSPVVTALQTAAPSRYSARDNLEKWFSQRAAAVAALTTSPHVPRSDLIALVPILDESALEAAYQHSEGELRSVCLEQLTRLRGEAEEARPKFVAVPNDDELAQQDDAAAVLHTHLKNLKGRAAQRDLTIDGLLRSRFTTPDILRFLPASRVLDSAEQAEQVAEMLVSACGDDQHRWSALPTRCVPPPARATTFGTWLDQLAADSAEGVDDG